MNTVLIEQIVGLALLCETKERREQFTGVHSIDKLDSEANLVAPGKLRMCIVNSQTSYEPGEHWFVVGVDLREKDKRQWHAFVFDSLAQYTKYPRLVKFF